MQQSPDDLSAFFEVPPTQWGLRGDPGLWDELRDRFRLVPLPATESAFWRDLEQAFEEAVGCALADRKSVNVDRFNRGGMSQGAVSPEFWAETGFPLLVRRYSQEISRRSARD